ncbi:MFS transporter [Sulfitobacter alexandrii]|uniref:MFS transporter n=1 Tax=Sulfitobacter alexandrii TaxID=1917485 RepID=A0A1J0WI70_9RHOB|nr:MFS transporter [Sulfitobacter alexandrii]APE44017.1 MFS transporter [Sulfitobacter alexandrii]
MSRKLIFPLYYAAILFQAGAYGLTFMLPRLYDGFGANEKVVGTTLLLTTVATVVTVYFSGHLSDLMGRLRTLGMACVAISAALMLYATADGVGPGLMAASVLLGFGWGLTYSLGPIVMSRLVRADERVRYFTLLSVFVMGGFGFAPVIASALENAGFAVRDAFALNSVLCLISAALFFGLDRPIRLQAVNARPEAPSRITRAAVRGVLRSPARLPVFMVFLGASIFAGLNNFQTVFADARGLDYAWFFTTYTLTSVIFRLVMARFTGGPNPYLTIALLQCLMCVGLGLFVVSGDSLPLYLLVAVLFGLGYGVSYPVLVAMAADDADEELGAQTLQLFALTYFIGIFGFPLVAGWMIVEVGTRPLLILITALAVLETGLALRRGLARRNGVPRRA